MKRVIESATLFYNSNFNKAHVINKTNLQTNK